MNCRKYCRSISYSILRNGESYIRNTPRFFGLPIFSRIFNGAEDQNACLHGTSVE
jgi:hypothetical protein